MDDMDDEFEGYTMQKIYEELVAELADLGLEFKEIPSIFLPENNDDQESANKKAKITEIEEIESDQLNNDSKLNLDPQCSSSDDTLSQVVKNDINTPESLVNEQNKPGSSKNIDSAQSIENQLELFNSQNDSKNSKKSQYSRNLEEEEENNFSGQDFIPPEGFSFPIEYDSSDMLDEVDLPEGSWPNPTDRYFTRYYQIDVQSPGDDICILIHSNRVCMITLAESHLIFQENKSIESINFKVSEKLDRTQNKVSGKAKHGAQPLQTNSNLCCINCSDGTKYMIKCCMIGKLVEINDGLVDFPDMLKLEPHFGGYIALVLPNLKHLDNLKEKLLNQEQYNDAIKKRMENKETSGNIKTNEEKEKEREQLFLQYCNKLNSDAEKIIKEAELKKKSAEETVNVETEKEVGDKT